MSDKVKGDGEPLKPTHKVIDELHPEERPAARERQHEVIDEVSSDESDIVTK